MDFDKETVSDVVSVVAIFSLLVFGLAYIVSAGSIHPVSVVTIAAGLAGLGGYQLRRRSG